MIRPVLKKHEGKRRFSEQLCYIAFLLLISPVLYYAGIIASGNPWLFHTLLFITGFITFTFFEYIAHRFWMHAKEKNHPGKSLQRHMMHHHHPTEIKITPLHRTCLVLLNIVLVSAAFLFDNYFTLAVGLYSGFVYYCFMHFLLHQPWAGKVFTRLQISHIHHHCRYPDRCFGVCTVWWDHLFNTSVPGEVKISPRVQAFYFGKSGH